MPFPKSAWPPRDPDLASWCSVHCLSREIILEAVPWAGLLLYLAGFSAPGLWQWGAGFHQKRLAQELYKNKRAGMSLCSFLHSGKSRELSSLP